MTLTQIKKRGIRLEPVFKSEDPSFNHKAAQATYNMIMKMDDDEASMFVHILVSDMLEQDISKNLRTLQSHLDKVVAKRINTVKRATMNLISKQAPGQDAVEFAKALREIEEITKAGRDDWDEALHPRSKSGRFRTKVSHNQTKPLHPKTAEAIGIRGLNSAPYTNLSDDKHKAQYQDEYRQLANFLSSVNQSVHGGDTDIFLHFAEKDRNGNRTGEVYTEKLPHGLSPKKARESLKPDEADLVEIEAVPNTLRAGGVAFALQHSLGADPTTDHALSRNVNYLDRELPGFADEWIKVDGNDAYNTNARTYRRVQRGAELVGGMAPPGSKLQLAATTAQFVGSHGPEAEKVLGPTARKTAYRYRGTSKPPEAELVQSYDNALRVSEQRGQFDAARRTRERAATTRALNNWRLQEAKRTGKPMDTIRVPADKDAEIRNAVKARFTTEAKKLSFEERDAGRIAIQQYLLQGQRLEDKKKHPRKDLYGLHLASGNTPPSEGVLLDKDGKIVDQAIGYADDHYIPFNLKNLSKLKGGEYIRSRSVGGLTTEDIYTGLMTGARQVTVVSRSGVFTMTFEPDFTGKRRHNDKAHRMTQRYAQILDAVQSEQVDRKGVSAEVRQAIMDKVKADNPGESPRALNALVAQKVQEFQEAPELSEQDENLVRLIASHRAMAATSGASRDAQDYMNQVTQDLAKEKEYRFRLNGMGYADALEALREQFPYYITVQSHPTQDPDLFRPELDRGYVEPGRNRPTQAMGAGLYGTTINEGLKRQGLKTATASRVNNQDTEGNRRLGIQGVAPARAETQSTEREGTTGRQGGAAVEDDVDRAIQRSRRNHARGEAADELYKQLHAPGVLGSQTLAAFPWLNKSPDEFSDWSKEPDNAKEIDKFLNTLTSDAGYAGLSSTLKNAVDKYRRASGDIDSVKFDPSLVLKFPREPYQFDAKPYTDPTGKSDAEKEDLRELRANEVRKINERTKSVLYGGNLSSLSDAKMKREVEQLAEVYRIVKENPDLARKVKQDDAEGLAARKRLREGFFQGPNFDPEAINFLLKNPNKMLDRMEDVHRMRLLMKLGGFSDEQREANFTGRAPSPAPRPAGQGILENVSSQIGVQTALKRQAAVIGARLADIGEDNYTDDELLLHQMIADYNLVGNTYSADEARTIWQEMMELDMKTQRERLNPPENPA